MRKILIFENQFIEMEGAFKGFKVLSKNEIDYEVYKSSQEFGDLNKSLEFDIILVDLDLVPSSKLTGYEILDKLIEIHKHSDSKINVLTGHGNATEELKRRKIMNIQIIEKPLGQNHLIELFGIIK